MRGVTLLLILAFTASLDVWAQTEFGDSATTRALDEVVVKGERPQITGRDGVLSVDLPAIVRDKPVTNILDALAYLPGVVSRDGAISLNGATSVTIILNGEPTNMPLRNLYQLLYSTPVDRLKTVEIMYSAPAKYHVSGAVINIVLKTPRPIDGLMGQVTADYTQTHYASYSGGVAATYAIKDWTFDFNWSLGQHKDLKRQLTQSNHLVDGQRTMIEDDMRQISRGLNNLLYGSVSYRRLKLTYNGQINGCAANKSISTGTLGEYTNHYSYPSPVMFHSLVARYESDFGLTVGGDYTAYSESRNQNLTKGTIELVRASNRQTIRRYHVYIDQEHELGRWTFNYGAEFQHSDDHSRQAYTYPALDGFDGVLREDVANAYVGLQASFDWGLSFVSSLKGEYFHNDYRHNWNFVPQIGATFYKTPVSIFQLNFTSERGYPQYWELHGATSYINDYAMIKGNPELQPHISYSGQLSYILKQKYAATLYLLYSDKFSTQLPYQLPDNLQLLFQTINMDFSRTAGLQIQVPFRVGAVLNSTAVANVSNLCQKASRFHDASFDNQRWSVYGALENTLKLSSVSPVSLSFDISWIRGQIQGPGRFSTLWKVDAGAKWRFGRQRNCELALKLSDLFNTWNPRLTIKYGTQDYRMDVRRMTQNLKLTFVWRFNGFKPKEPADIDTSRFGTGK